MHPLALTIRRIVLTGAACAVLPLAVGLPASAQDRDGRERETMIDERFSVSPGGMLEVQVGDADVEVVTSDTSELSVEVVLSARNLNADAREYYERQNFSVTQTGGVVRVATDPARRLSFGWRSGWSRTQIAVHISAPEDFNANLRTSDGDLSLTSMRGDVQLRSSDGDISVGELIGGALALRTSDGDIAARSLRGDVIEVQSSDGDINLGAVTGGRVTARTSDGDIRAASLTGQVSVRTSDGDISIDTVSGPTFAGQGSDGSIRVGALNVETSTVRTADGDITLGHVAGALEVGASDGDISIDLVPGQGANLELRGGRVNVSGDFRIQGEIRRDRVSGTMNGGGVLITARASDGHVTVSGD